MKNKHDAREIFQYLRDAEISNTGSYFMTATIRDPSKSYPEEGDLQHFTVMKNFKVDDIVPSLDKALSSLGIKPEKQVEVVRPKLIREKRKPLKIAILTHLNRAPDSFSPGKAVKNQVKLLQRYGHDVVLFLAEGSQLEVDCEMRKVVTRFRRQKNVIDHDAKEDFKKVLKRELTDDFDVVITQDMYIDDCITYREAIKECGVNLPFLHWARSGVGRPIDFKMKNARYVYMNYADVGRFASRINVDSKDVRVVFNEKDGEFFFHWNPITNMIVNKYRLWEKDIIQTLAVCTTRLSAKGTNGVINTFAALKKRGKNVMLIICNSNGRRRLDEIQQTLTYAKERGLNEGDIVFTSTLASDEFNIVNEVPNKIVAELLQVSNLFVFATHAEVCPNLLLEAAMNKNLLVLNKDLPLLYDFIDKSNCLSYSFASLQSVHYKDRGGDSYGSLADNIIAELDKNKADLSFRQVWRNHNVDSVYYNQLMPILYE